MAPYPSFLDDYKVNINLDLPTFLKKANLTQRAQKYLKDYLSAIELLYRVPYDNFGEVLFFQADLMKWVGQYTGWTVAVGIASSMPYDCIIALRYRNIVRIYAFDRHENARNARKSVIDEGIVSPPIDIGRLSCDDRLVLEFLESTLTTKNSPKEVFFHLGQRFDKIDVRKRELYQKYIRTIEYAQYDAISVWEFMIPQEEFKTFFELYESLKREENYNS